MRVQHRKSGPTRTQQGLANETDINFLVARYLRTGVVDPRLANRRPIFGDFSSVDFQAMMNKVTSVQGEFRSLPSRLRSRFGNDPFQLVRFVEDPKNRAEAIKLGLLQPTVEEVDAALEARRKADFAAAKAASAAAAAGEQLDLEEEAAKPPPRKRSGKAE